LLSNTIAEHIKVLCFALGGSAGEHRGHRTHSQDWRKIFIRLKPDFAKMGSNGISGF
jgi:hypothetical protein